MFMDPLRHVPAQEAPPPLRAVDELEGEGLRYTLDHTFVSAAGVPGYLFAIAEIDGAPVGSVTVMITTDLDAVARTGHMGCEVVPERRRQGYTTRIARGLLPFVREHGIRELLFACDVGHTSQMESIRALGAEPLDELPPEAPGKPPIARFRMLLE